MKENGFFRKLNFLIALGGIFAAAAFCGCSNLLASDSANDTPANFVQAKNGYGIVSGILPSENNSASARTAMPSKPDETNLSYKVFAQSGSKRIEANVNDANKTFSISLPFGTWKITANALLSGRIVFTQTREVALSETNSNVSLDFTSLTYSTNPEDGDGEISLSVSLGDATSLIRGIEYTLSKGEEKIIQNVSDIEDFKIEHTTENLGAWHLTIRFYGDFSNLVYRIDQTVNVYANLTTDKFEGSAPYISGGAIALSKSLLADFQNTTLYVNATSGKDTNTGTQFDPLQTLNRAVELVNNSTRDASTEFRILLQTDVADGAALELKDDKKLTIAGADGTARTITSLGRTFVVAATSELTVHDLKFKKLRFEVSGTFTMNGGEISGNEFKDSTSAGGGAIFIATTGKAIISDVTISENSVDNVYGKLGGGIYASGALEMENCAIKNNEAANGGGIYAVGNAALLTMKNCTISNKPAHRGGGIYASNAKFTMENGAIDGNEVDDCGGGVYVTNNASFTIKGGTIGNNNATNEGGGIWISDDSELFIEGGGTIEKNEAKSGGGVYASGTLELKNGTISENASSQSGGAVYNEGTFIMTAGIISKNTATYNGGGVYVNGSGTFTMNGGEISENTATYAGGVFVRNNGTFTMKGGTISKNTVSENGGGVSVHTGTVEIEDGIIEKNTATNGGGIFVGNYADTSVSITFKMNGGIINGNNASYGGGIYVKENGAFTMENGTISENSANSGGGVYVYGDASASGTFTMKGGEISKNEATDSSKGSGGGVYVYNGTFTMESGTISENKAKGVDGESFGGGGIYLYRLTSSMPGGKFTLKGGTVSGNEAKFGGGIWVGNFSEFAMEGGEFNANESTDKGNGAYVNLCTFKMSGTAKFAEDNDVYLTDSLLTTFPTITVAGTLTAESPVATITPSEYSNENSDRQVLSAGTGVTITQDICNQFALTPDPDGTIWKISPSGAGTKGVLKTKMDIYVRGTGAGWYTEHPDFTASAGNDTTGNGKKEKPFATIQKAIEAIIEMNDGADDYTIFVDGTLTQSAAANANGMADFSALDKNLNLTITALSDTTKATLDANKKSRVIYAKPASGILNLTLENLVITGGNVSGVGGGISFNSNGGTLKIKNSEISKNTVTSHGGGIHINGSSTFIMNGCTISENIANGNNIGNGAGIYIENGVEATISNTTLSGNKAESNGGAIYADNNCNLTMEEDCTISGNSASGSFVTKGGGVYVTGSTFTMTGGTISEGNAKLGGGVFINSGKFIMNNGTTHEGSITRNTASQNGGGVYVSGGTFEMNYGKISSNKAEGEADSNGGGIYVAAGGTFTMNDGTISENIASGDGGGIYVSVGTFTMNDGTIEKNEAGYGGGVYNKDTFTMKKGSIADNKARGNAASGDGGGVYLNGGTFDMSGGTISGNETAGGLANSGGGGIYIYNSGTFSMTGGTFSSNKVANGQGNGAFIHPNCTFKMSGSAQFAESDDVYLYVYSGATLPTVTVAGALSKTEVATIKLPDSATNSAYTAGTKVLSKGGSVATITQVICDKFALSKAGWKIAPDGTGANGVLKVDTDIYVRGSNATWYASNAPTAANGSDTTGDGTKAKPFATIQKAVDTVLARNDGTSEWTINLDGTFTAASSALADFDALSQPLSVKILGLDASQKAVLNGNNAASGIVVGASGARKDVNFTLENLTVQNAAGKGITLYCQSTNSHTIKNCEIKNNANTGIYHYYGSLDLQDCEISGHTTTNHSGGGIESQSGTLTMTNCTVSKNSAERGAGIYFHSSGALTMKDCAISENIANNYGGGVYAYHSENVTMVGCTISKNQASNGGGVYFNAGDTSSPVMKDCTVSGNEASKGNGAYVLNNGRTVKLMLDGTTKFAKDDDIYLSIYSFSSSTVGVMSTLTTAAPVATITPDTYKTIGQVLSAGTGVTITQDVCDKFAVTPQDDGTNWKILPKPSDSTAGVLVSADTSTIYLNSSSGDDANFGLSASNAVKTLSKAIELFDAYNSEKIMVCARYTLPSEERTLLNRAGKSKVTLMRYDGSSEVSGVFTGDLLTVSQGNVTITNVTLDGNKDNVTAISVLLSIESGNVTLGDGATICNNRNGAGSGSSGGAIYMQGSGTTVKMMDGAKITGNESTNNDCGGIYVNNGTFEMSGGTISGNTATGNGGGVYVSGGTFTMSDGTISGNTAGKNGGGVYVGYTATFTISGGKITGNTAGKSKNGVYVNGTFTNIGGTVQSD